MEEPFLGKLIFYDILLGVLLGLIVQFPLEYALLLKL